MILILTCMAILLRSSPDNMASKPQATTTAPRTASHRSNSRFSSSSSVSRNHQHHRRGVVPCPHGSQKRIVGSLFTALTLILFSRSAYTFVVPMSEWHISYYISRQIYPSLQWLMEKNCYWHKSYMLTCALL